MLEIHDLFFRYQKKSPFLLSGLSFTLKEGECIMLLGANGTGKSTLLGLLNGRLQPESGSVTLNGTNLSTIPARERAKWIATVHQLPEELPGFTVEEMVMLGRTPYLSRLGTPARSDHEAVRTALELLELTDLADRDVRQLSGGERQRVMLAAALVRQTPYLLLDEPTAAADPARRISLLHLLKTLPWKPGILAITHDITAAQDFADRYLLLNNAGKLETASALNAENITRLYGKDAVFFLKRP